MCVCVLLIVLKCLLHRPRGLMRPNCGCRLYWFWLLSFHPISSPIHLNLCLLPPLTVSSVWTCGSVPAGRTHSGLNWLTDSQEVWALLVNGCLGDGLLWPVQGLGSTSGPPSVITGSGCTVTLKDKLLYLTDEWIFRGPPHVQTSYWFLFIFLFLTAWAVSPTQPCLPASSSKY